MKMAKLYRIPFSPKNLLFNMPIKKMIKSIDLKRNFCYNIIVISGACFLIRFFVFV